MRILHYVNQFFAGIGGEDKADTPLHSQKGAVGPGRALEMALQGEGHIVETLVCGDNAFHADPESTIAEAIAVIDAVRPDLVIAGPAFNAGRYGLACGAVCAAASERLGIPSITALYPDAPAVDVYRARVVMVPASDSAAGMRQAIERIARIAPRLAAGSGLRPADEDGRIPMGYRGNWPTDVPAAERAVDMLMRKHSGEDFRSEVELPEQSEPMVPAPAVRDLSHSTVAVVTEGGLVPEGNPDRIESSSATRWARYPISMLEDSEAGRFRSIHAGYDSRWVDEDPNRMVPIDALRELETRGEIGALHEYFYVTTGTGTTVTNAERIGDEIAKQLVSDGVQAVILTST